MKTTVNNLVLPTQRHGCNRHPCDTTDAPPLFATVSMATAGVVVVLFFLCVPLTTMAAAVVDEEGKNDK